MLTDAVLAEWYKAWRNRSAWFWGFAFVPLVTLISRVYIDTYTRFRLGGGVPMNLDRSLLEALASPLSSFALLFFAFGAAAIFTNEYRWETWRLITPRNTRANLIGAKFITYGLAAALSLLALGLASLLSTFYAAAMNGASLPFPIPGFVLQVLGVFAASWIELLVLGAFAALIAVVSRSMIGTMIAAIVFSIVQPFSTILFFPPGISVAKMAAVPHFSAQVLNAFAVSRPNSPNGIVGFGNAVLAALFLICWIVIFVSAALLLFQRQDLARE